MDRIEGVAWDRALTAEECAVLAGPPTPEQAALIHEASSRVTNDPESEDGDA